MLGFGVTGYGPSIGLPAAFLAAGDYHHHIGLNASPPPPGHTGLYHLAIVYPDAGALGRAVGRLLEHDHPTEGASDHGATVSVYLRDPDGNGVEYYDRPRREWFDEQGRPVLRSDPIDVRALIRCDREGAPRRHSPHRRVGRGGPGARPGE